VSDENKKETSEEAVSDEEVKDTAAEKDTSDSGQSGPKFTKPPGDPLASVKKGASQVQKGASQAMASMEGKTVSMKLYVGSIIGVIVLMMLARCGG